jgi:Bacterial regulatory proteins, gntR family
LLATNGRPKGALAQSLASTEDMRANEFASPLARSDRVAAKGGPKRKRGTPPEKLEATKAAMRQDIKSGLLTCEGLQAMREKNLEARYGVSRCTARTARNDVESEFVEKCKSDK